MTTIRKVSKVLVREPGGKILVLRRSRDDIIRPGDLDFPGGSVDQGESFEIAARREVREEAGFDIPLDNLTIMYTHTDFDKDKNIIRVLSLAVIDTIPEVILSAEHDAYWWKSMEDVIAEFKHPVYGKALEYLTKHQLV